MFLRAQPCTYSVRATLSSSQFPYVCSLPFHCESCQSLTVARQFRCHKTKVAQGLLDNCFATIFIPKTNRDQHLFQREITSKWHFKPSVFLNPDCGLGIKHGLRYKTRTVYKVHVMKNRPLTGYKTWSAVKCRVQSTDWAIKDMNVELIKCSFAHQVNAVYERNGTFAP